MLKIKKKDWIEIVLHVAFWIGVFYTLLSLTETHITIRVDHTEGALKKDPVVIRDVRHTLSAYLFITLGFSELRRVLRCAAARHRLPPRGDAARLQGDRRAALQRRPGPGRVRD